MAKGPVEIWLMDLLKMQMSSLHNIIRSAFYQISDSGFQLLPFLNHFPAQVRIYVSIMEIWGKYTQEAIGLDGGAAFVALNWLGRPSHLLLPSPHLSPYTVLGRSLPFSVRGFATLLPSLRIMLRLHSLMENFILHVKNTPIFI